VASLANAIANSDNRLYAPAANEFGDVPPTNKQGEYYHDDVEHFRRAITAIRRKAKPTFDEIHATSQAVSDQTERADQDTLPSRE
jgi:hypothetical protein